MSLLTLRVGLHTLSRVGVSLGKLDSVPEAHRNIVLEVVKLVEICHLVLRLCLSIVKSQDTLGVIVRRNIL